MTAPTVLFIIDDDIDDQEFLIAAFKDIHSSIECFTANNGQEAIRKLEKNTIPFPSIIFLDLNMPRINGQQFLQQLKKKSTSQFHSCNYLLNLL